MYDEYNPDSGLNEDTEQSLFLRSAPNEINEPVKKSVTYQSGTPIQKTVPVYEEDEQKRKNILIVLALCLVCALVGAVGGGFLSGTIVKNSIEAQTQLPQTQNQTASSETTTVQQTETTVQTAETTTKNESETIQSGMYTSADDKPSKSTSFKPSDIYKNNVGSVVSIEVSNGYSKGYGTGFIVSEEGYIVTNYHVVEDTNSVFVTLYDESTYSAEVVGYEESNDIAVIKIEPKNTITSVLYGKSSDLQVGDDVYVIGNPLGDLTFTLTRGVVSALNRLIDTGSGFTINMFQTDAAINSGNSGGPVFDEHGYVVGIASAKYASASIEGLSFCVPIDDVRSMLDEIINKGYVSGKPVIGVSVYDKEITNYGFIQSQRSINGAKVYLVGSGTAAQKAGIQKGDVIVAADGQQIKSVSQLRTVLSEFRSGDTIKLKLSRQGSYVEVNVVLDEYAPTSPRTDYSYIYDL